MIVQIQKPHALHQLIGKLCKIHPCATEIDTQLELSTHTTEQCLDFQEMYNLYFIFINEPPHLHINQYLYCVKPVSNKKSGKWDDWYWFSLSQLIICEP